MEHHLHEQDIDLYLLNPDRLDPVRKRQMESHLATCSLCSELTSFLDDVYRELRNRSSEKDQRVEQFLAHLAEQAKVIELVPLRFAPHPSEFSQNTVTVLAAKSDVRTHYRYSSVCTLASRDEGTLVRILRDEEQLRYRLYLITQERRHASHAIVRFPSLGVDVTVPLDTLQADVHLPTGSPDVDWTTIDAELRFFPD